MHSSLNTVQEKRRSDSDIFGLDSSLCLKGVAIIILLFHHCFLRPNRYEGQTLKLFFPEYYLNYLASFGKICVCLFVFISAYALTKKMMSMNTDTDARTLSQSIGNLISSRLVKLLGSFAFVFLLLCLGCVFLSPGKLSGCYGTKFPDNAEYFLIDMLGLAQLLDTPTLIATFWYYTLAILIILIVPLFYLLLKRIGTVPFMSLVVILNFVIEFSNRNLWHYFLCIGVGVVCAYENTVTRWVNHKFIGSDLGNHVLKFFLEGISLFVLMVLREGPLKGELYCVWDAVIPVVIVCFCCEFLFHVPVLKQILKFLGIYSANIFLVHNFIRSVWFYDFTYSFQYPLLILLVLLLNSLVLSIAIELLKKLLHYNQFLNVIIRKLSRPDSGC